MNSLEDPLYRLQLAQGYLKRAEKDARDEEWDTCLANAQEAVENAGKMILGIFRPIPKTHNVEDELRNLIRESNLSGSIKKMIADGLESFREMGIETHARATYGDEKARIPPWKLIQQSEAEAGLEKARRTVALAQRVYDELTKPRGEEEEKK